MATLEYMTPKQQLALRDALKAGATGLVLRRDGYVAEATPDASGEDHPIRTVRTLVRSGLLAEIGGRVCLTDNGRLVAEGRA